MTESGPIRDLLVRRARLDRAALIARIGSSIRDLLAGRVARVVLYGSRARGDARDAGRADDSDWDVAVFVSGDPPNWEERKAAANWAYDLEEESGWTVSVLLFPAAEYDRRTMFMHGLRRDGIEL